MSKHWLKQKERGSPFLVHFILWVALKMGRKVARILLYPITFYFLVAAPIQRRASRDFFSRLWKRRATYTDGAKHIFCFASTILDRVFLISDRSHEFNIQIHGLDVLQKKFESHKGAVLLGSHLGSFDVLRAVAMLEPQLNLKVLMQIEHNAFITELLDTLNPEISRTVIPIGGLDSMLKVNECLNNGDMVAILGDRVADTDKIVTCQFLGAPAHFPAGPMLIANTCHAPIILIFGVYRGGNRYDIYFELFSDEITIDRNNRDVDVQKWVQKYADRLEHYAQKFPYNWFNFYDFWRQ